MLGQLVELSLRYRALVLIAAGGVAFLGWNAVQTVPIDAFPDVTPVQVNVYTESPGLAAEDVEQLLTFPVESGLAGLPSVSQIRSVSLFGLSYVAVYFDDNVDIYFARRLVMERLQEVAERLPEGYGTPEMGPNSSGLGQVYWYTLERTEEALADVETENLRTLHDWSVRPMLRTAEGVDDVMSWGGHEHQLQVVINPMQMIAYDLSFSDIIEAVVANNRQVGGQFVDIGAEQYLVRGMGLVRSGEDLGGIVIKVLDGTPVFLSDVADILEGGAARFGAVTRDGREVVLGMALSRTGENAAGVVQAVQERVDAVQSALPEAVALRPVYDRSRLVDEATSTAVRALVEGSVLVAIVLFLFLGDLRCAAVVISALPMAMLIAFIFMKEAGISANLMSLAGLAVGIGMMVDGAVVMVENAFRTMAERHSGGGSVDRAKAVLDAGREVANPVAFAIGIIVVVFIPLFALEGLEGKLFKPMALNIAFAMAGSLLLALTFIPVLSAVLIKPKEEKDTWLLRMAKAAYVPLLTKALANRGIVLSGAIALLVATLAMFPFLGREFMPTLQEGDIMWRVTGIPSSSLDQSIAVSIEIENALARFPEVQSTVAMIGRAEKGETVDVNYMEVYTKLLPYEDWPSQHDFASLAEAMREEIERVAPTTVIAFTQPIQMRVEELISGVRATLAVKIYGEDLAELDRLSSEVKEIVAGVEGVADLSLEANIGKPQIRIEVRRDRLARYGMNADEILEVVRTGIGNEPVSSILDGVRRFDITVRLDDASKASVAAIKQIPLRTADGAIVPLSAVANVSVAEGYSFVRRERLSRYAVIQMDVRDRDVDSFVREADAMIKSSVDLPPGYSIEWGGAFENQQRALKRLALIVPLTVFVIFVLLYTAFGSIRYAGLIIANVPFAAIGGIAALVISGQHVSVPSAIGLIAVFGVAMLNGIVLISFVNQLRAKGASVRDAVRRGAELRLRPVLMTASVAIFGLVPMLLSSGVGAETQRPLAGVVVGGLVTSTLLTLILLPVMYEWLEEKRGLAQRDVPSEPSPPAHNEL